MGKKAEMEKPEGYEDEGAENADEGAEGEGAEGEGAQGDEGEEDEDKMEKKRAAKSQLTEADLLKSLEALQAIADNGNQVSRKDALLRKAQTSDLTKAETDELFRLMGGGDEQTPGLADEATSNFAANDQIRKGIDVSDFLAGHSEEIVKSLGTLAEAIESQDRRQHEFNLVLAKALVDMGGLTKAMSQRLGVIEAQPARGPKSAGLVRPLAKSFAGQPASGDQLTRGQTLQAMTQLMDKSMQDGNGGLAPCGEDIVGAVAKYEQTGMISKSMRNDVVNFVRSRSA